MKIEILTIGDGFNTYFKIKVNDKPIKGAQNKDLLFTQEEMVRYINKITK